MYNVIFKAHCLGTKSTGFFYLHLPTPRYGNWNDVSRFVDTKGPNECRDAVNNFFVDGKASVLNICLNNCTTKDLSHTGKNIFGKYQDLNKCWESIPLTNGSGSCYFRQ